MVGCWGETDEEFTSGLALLETRGAGLFMAGGTGVGVAASGVGVGGGIGV